LILLIAVFFWSIYTVMGKPLTRRVNPVHAIFYILFFCSISLGILTLLLGYWPQVFTYPASAWPYILYLGIFGTGIPHLCYYQALKRLKASTVSVMLTTLPVFGIFLSYILLDERLTLIQGAGAVLIMVGVTYAVWVRK
jgi:drug/metabolite transporter (DMT)-like permease